MNTNTAYNNYNFKPFLGQNHLLHQSAHPNRPNHLFHFLEWKNCKSFNLTIKYIKHLTDIKKFKVSTNSTYLKKSKVKKSKRIVKCLNFILMVK